ncbi:hypothetical protein PHJA_000470100 [Phtheirospermum japonicum]|uniref:Uncharacterized protein n=1 Tax=Phtheirospermum japonicum TaxID=374723 RepID=A0A830B850_9LAMI|nr:hypothetical protein PHJA_000470100 [Phtheirospermum japonicum]
MDFDCCSNEGGLPVLQLRKWGPAEFPYNPSNFREGFISPMRKSLLLLSHDSMALLISLDEGQCMNSEDPEYLEKDIDIGYSSPVGFPRNTDAFISDVHSVAWGLCGDASDQHEETSFRELLFVSGKDGVVVHAFSQFNESSEAIKSAQESNVGKGMWVEWGPSIVEDGESASRKIWMRTFLTESKRLTSGTDVYTEFPKRPSFPSNVVVSFRIFDRDWQSSEQVNRSGSVVGPNTSESDTDVSSSDMAREDDSASHAASSLYKCVKVFSNISYQLVGFAVNIRDANDGNYSKVQISAARIVSWGIQWLYSAKIDENLDGGPFEWIDFTFSCRFLICLGTSGLISLYGATTGEFMAFIDVVNNSGPGYCLSSQEPKNDSDVHNQMREKLSHQIGSLACKRRFKRLFAFPYSSSLGVMDECGVIYVMHADNSVPEDHSSFENLFRELGLLTIWEVGGAEIGYQRVFSKPSAPRDLVRLSVLDRSSYCIDGLPSKEHPRDGGINIKDGSHNGSYNTTSSGATQIMSQKNVLFSDYPPHLRRKVFLPPSRYSEDDITCCTPFGITRLIKRYSCEKKRCQVVHSNLQLDFIVNDEINYRTQSLETSTNEAVGCNFHGFLYLVTEKGLSVVLPSISVPSNFFPVGAIGYILPNCTSSLNCGAGILEIDGMKKPLLPWQVEVLDRVLLYEGPEVAEKLCLENGWNLGISRIRRLQLALVYLEFDKIENSLEMLMGLNLAVEGILRLLFAAVYMLFNKVSNDNEVSAASRLLALATGYATRVMRKYGLLQHKKAAVRPWDVRGDKDVSLLLELTDKEYDAEGNSRSLQEMGQLLVVVRSLQGKLNAKFKRPGKQLTDNAGLQNLVSAELSEDEPKVPVVSEDALLDTSDQREIAAPASGTDLNKSENLALVPADTNGETTGFENSDRAVLVSEGSAFGKRAFKVENSKDMIARWELDNMDLKTVVKDALLSGRLPLAVLRLHLHHLNNLLPGTESHDTFNDVRTAGRAIAYDLFLKGEVGLAITTLQKLGEDVEITLKQLVFGTVRRSLRVQIAEEMKRYAYLGPHELKILEMVSLIERVYPCNSFFITLASRRKELNRVTNEDALGEISLRLLHPLFNNLTILCGEIDGVVLGSWKIVDEHPVAPEADDDSSHAAYWTAAVAWSDAWDQRVIDRVSQ